MSWSRKNIHFFANLKSEVEKYLPVGIFVDKFNYED